jgi:hypothetical protein
MTDPQPDRTGASSRREPGADARHQEPPVDEQELGVRCEATRTIPANRSEAQDPDVATEDPVPPSETTEPG